MAVKKVNRPPWLAIVFGAFLLLFCQPELLRGATTNLPLHVLVNGASNDVTTVYANDGGSCSAPKDQEIVISRFPWVGGAITSVVLHMEFSVDGGYNGTNAIQVNGVNTAVVPADGDVNRAVTVDITGGAFQIDSWPKMSSLSISFANNDGANPSDDVHFDYVYIVVLHGTSTEIPPTWSEEFESVGQANPAIWTYEEGYQRNNEDQYYVVGASNGWQENGMFVIEGREESMGGYNYTAASIYTPNKYYWLYGRAQIRAQIPAIPGLWPAIWGTGKDSQWPHNGEVDIMEYYGENIKANCAVGGATAWSSQWRSSSTSVPGYFEPIDPGWRTNFHIWTMQWDQQNVRLYIDNVLLKTVPQSQLLNNASANPSWGPNAPYDWQKPFTQPFTCWLNLAIGGDAGGNPATPTYPVRYYIDYWRIWEGATNNVAPTDITLSPDSVQEGLPIGTVVGYIQATDADPAEVIRYSLVTGTGDDDNAQFLVPEFTSDCTDKVLLKTAAVLNYDDGPTWSIRVRATDIEGATYTKALTINVIPIPAVEVSTNAFSVPEGSTANLSVRLRSMPSNTITVNVARISGDTDLTVQSGSPLYFTSGNYTNWQVVTLAAATDVDLTNGIATFVCSDLGGVYNSATVTVSEADSDNDPPVADAGPNQTVSLDGVTMWTPAEIALQAWYDASDTNTITHTAGTVTAWADKSGNTNDLTAANDPQTGSRNIGGSNVIDFAGDRFQMNSDINMLDRSAFLVVEADNIAAGNQMFFGRSTENVQLRVATSGAIEYRAQSPYYNTNPSSTTLLTNAQPAVIGFLLNVNMEYSVHGNFDSSGGNDGSGMTTYNWVGERSGGNNFDGVIGEIIITDALPDTDTRQDIEGYLSHKWSLEGMLPAGHPHKSAAPSLSATVVNLDGTVSDPNSDPLTTTWSLVSGPAGVTFGNSNAVDTTVEITVVGVYVLRLSAFDGVDTTTSDVTITVNAPGSDTCSLTVVSAYGSPGPSGVSAPSSNSTVNASITDSPVSNGGTQYVCTGWAGTGSATSGSGTNTSFTITTDSTITWQWITNFFIELNVIGN